jgi:hypothetical protein
MISLSIELAYSISIFILFLSTIISSLELASIPKLYIDFVYPEIEIKNKRIKWNILNYTIIGLSIISGVMYLLDEVNYFRLFFILTTVALLYLNSIRRVGRDGADQIRVIAYLVFTLCLLLDNETGKLIVIGFLGIQALIAYATSGLAKLLSIHWRKGNVLADVLGTNSYGVPKIKDFLKKRPLMEKGLSYAAIATMIAVPICFFIPNQGFILVALLCMFLFHFSTAVLMGLNDFLFTFPLTYPGILILHSIYTHLL